MLICGNREATRLGFAHGRIAARGGLINLDEVLGWLRFRHVRIAGRDSLLAFDRRFSLGRVDGTEQSAGDAAGQQ